MDLFWDFDGTLFDTYPIMVKSFEQALQLNGVRSSKTTELYRAMRQGSLGKTLEKYASENRLDLQGLKKDYSNCESQLLDQAKPFAGALAVCHKNISKHGRNFLLTHRDDQAKKLLKVHGFEHLFTGFITGSDHFARKPDPASLNYLLQKYKVDKKNAIMIGDRNLDILAAHNAGIKGFLFDPDNTISVTSFPEKQVKSLNKLSLLFN